MYVFCRTLKQIHQNKFSLFLIFQKRAVQDCAAAHESLNTCEECQYPTKQKNCTLTNCDTAPKSGYSCSKFIYFRICISLCVKFIQQNISVMATFSVCHWKIVGEIRFAYFKFSFTRNCNIKLFKR